MLCFEKSNIGKLELRNRIVLPPMCMNMADNHGNASNFHYVHYGNASIGGVGLIIVEATAVTPEGRIGDQDLGFWDDGQIEGHRKIVEFAHDFGAKIGIQLAHAGRKSFTAEGPIYAPSALRFDETYATPEALDKPGIDRIIEAFREGAIRAVKSGYDLIEIHGAHGYLLHEFLSPLTNLRTDEYGGSAENRCRVLMEVAAAVKSVIPNDMPLIVRVSATDYKAGGIEIEEMIHLVDLFKGYFDAIHVSSGGLVPDALMRIYPGYQVTLSEKIKHRCNVKTIAVGLLKEMDQIEAILQNDRADFVALGRLLLRDPYFLLREAKGEIEIPFAIQRGFKFI